MWGIGQPTQCPHCDHRYNLQRLLPQRSEEKVLKHSLFNVSEALDSALETSQHQIREISIIFTGEFDLRTEKA